MEEEVMKERVLFKRSDDPSAYGRVVMNWMGDPVLELEMMARGYGEVAHGMVEAIKARKVRLLDTASFEPYPIVFLYRHAFELSLKAIIFAGQDALREKAEEPMKTQKVMTHPLMPLFQEINRIMGALVTDQSNVWDFGGPEVQTREQLEAIVREFDEFDRGSFAFRYSITKGPKVMAAPLEAGFEFDLFRFAEIIDRIIPVMSRLPGWVRETLELRAEAKFEAQAAAESVDGESGDCDRPAATRWLGA